MTGRLLDSIPLWGIFVLSCLIALVAIEGGFWLGAWSRRTVEHELEGMSGRVAGSVLTLLSFMLGITFGGSASRFETRRALLLDEVNAISRTYLRAGFLPEPHRNQSRELLRDYVDIRADLVNLTQRPEEFRNAVARSEALQDQLWSHAEAIAAVRRTPIDALFIASLNEMIDLHTKRLVVSEYRIPAVIWGVLSLIFVLAMAAVGFQFGLKGARSRFANMTLVLAFSAVLLLNLDLDRPLQGQLTVSQQPLIDLQRKLNAQGE
jgi:hypothetical protein